MTKSAALEYAPRGIRVNAVCPGTIETPMVARMIADGELSVEDAVAGQPIGRLGRGDEIAASVLWRLIRSLAAPPASRSALIVDEQCNEESRAAAWARAGSPAVAHAVV